MKSEKEYLSDEDLTMLEEFLLSRFPDEDDHSDKDEGILDLSELDGYFAAIVSAPQLVPPSVWLPAMWGDFLPIWESKEEAEKILALLMEVMNSINESLLDPKSNYMPLFEHREYEGVTHVIVEEWCFGYMRGVALCEEEWNLEGLDMKILLTPIRTFGTYDGLDLLKEMTQVEVENIQKNIIPNTHDIFNIFRGENNSLDKIHGVSPHQHATPFVRENEKIGRNDPCSCGSGKKFKKCCLH